MKNLSAWSLGVVFLGAVGVACGGGKISVRDDDGGGGAGPGCDDETKNNEETDVDCGGDSCNACADGKVCAVAEDCESAVCEGGKCAAPECGDGVANGDEDCDSEGKATKACNADCTAPKCGDGVVNKAAGELCEPKKGQELWARCNKACTYGALLDGTWEQGEFAWAELGYATAVATWTPGLPEFHYSGQPYIYDLAANVRYEIATNTWTALPNPVEYDSLIFLDNGAVDSKSIWLPRQGKMYRFLFDDESWEEAAPAVPDGGSYEDGGEVTQMSAAVFDGDGYIWYNGGADTLVRFDTESGDTQGFTYGAELAAFDVYVTRFAYDPLGNRLVFTGYRNDAFAVFDLESEEFSLGSPSPGGPIRVNGCQDRAGGIYVGSTNDPTRMYRYDIEADEFTELPQLPIGHDGNSTCVVSEDGFLYTPIYDFDSAQTRLFRLELNKRAK